ncbi:Serine carboxypeptidase-like 6, partial [Ananas comosus]
ASTNPSTPFGSSHDYSGTLFGFSDSTLIMAAKVMWRWRFVSPIISPPQYAGRRSIITSLPGFDGPLPISLETGYVEVDEENGVQLFYYFIESERNAQEDPLMLWLTGGPGCSAFSGLVYEIVLVAPSFDFDNVSSIIFLDSPVGTGFSYSVLEEGYNSSDTKAVDQILIFLKKWFVDHPEFKSNPLYIGGDSYSGLIIPAVTLEIANSKLFFPYFSISIYPLFVVNSIFECRQYLAFLLSMGYLAGNPVTDGEFDSGARVPFAHGMALISDELYESAKESCGGKYTAPRNAQCWNYLQAVYECTKGINGGHILEPNCEFASPHPFTVSAKRRKMLAKQSEELSLLTSSIPTYCRTYGYLLSKYWADNDTVRAALGIHKGTVPSWKRCNFDLPYTKDIWSAVVYHLKVTTKGYRALVYSGDHDFVIPFLGTQAWIRSLNFSVVDEWRPWSVDGQVAGFTRSYSNNLTFATVKGAGHTAPEYKRKESLSMLERWLSGVPVDEENGVQLFFYFIESERNAQEDPLMLWLTGGPGCSAFSGLVYEIGYELRAKFSSLSSIMVSSIIFLDSPVGTGFSYSVLEEGYNSSDTKAVDQILIFLKKWFLDHPEFKSNPLYIGGDSYSGMIIPAGYLAGNPVTDKEFDKGAKVPFAHGMALISDELYEVMQQFFDHSSSAKESCGGKYTAPGNAQCANYLQAVDECTNGINEGNILEPKCEFASPHPLTVSAERRKMLEEQFEELSLLKSSIPKYCRTYGYLLSKYWADNDTVREALGIRKGTVPSWKRCNYDLPYTKDIPSAVVYHLKVTTKGYRALVYSGDHDFVIPFLGTQAWIRSLNFSIVDEWRPWSVDGQVAGFTRSYSNNLTFATVKGAGHTAPEYKRKESLSMLER